MDGYQRFLKDPRRAWEERLNPAGPMRELWEALAAARPNPGHQALVELEELGVLKCTITQNVDNLHRAAGSERLLEIHGNATLIRCIECVARYPRESIDFAELPPRCPSCRGILKSDTVSFGEPIPPDVLDRCFEEAERADCMIVAGTSATVYPAAQFPITIHQRGGDLLEVNPYDSEITPLCRHGLRAPRSAAPSAPAACPGAPPLRRGARSGPRCASARRPAVAPPRPGRAGRPPGRAPRAAGRPRARAPLSLRPRSRACRRSSGW